MPRVTVQGDLTVGGVGFLPAGSTEVDAEQLAAFKAHPLFAEDVASGRIKVEGDEPEPGEDEGDEPPKRGRKAS